MDAGRFRPTEVSVASVRERMVEQFRAQADAGRRLADLQAERCALKAAGKTALAEQKAGEIGVVERELKELEAIGEALDQMLAEVRRAETGKAAMQRVGEAGHGIYTSGRAGAASDEARFPASESAGFCCRLPNLIRVASGRRMRRCRGRSFANDRTAR
jgi:hypothetical protein